MYYSNARAGVNIDPIGWGLLFVKKSCTSSKLASMKSSKFARFSRFVLFCCSMFVALNVLKNGPFCRKESVHEVYFVMLFQLGFIF